MITRTDILTALMGKDQHIDCYGEGDYRYFVGVTSDGRIAGALETPEETFDSPIDPELLAGVTDIGAFARSFERTDNPQFMAIVNDLAKQISDYMADR